MTDSSVASTPIVVLAGIIWQDDLLLIAQRTADSKVEGGKWEFPGGKLEQGEGLAERLAREIREELGIEIDVGERYAENTHTYELSEKRMTIHLIAYAAAWRSGELSIIDCQDAQWIRPAQLREFTFAAADIPFVEQLLQDVD